MSESRPPVPPFNLETAIQKTQAAQDAGNTRDLEHVAEAYTLDSHWRNRDEHIIGRDQIVEFLTRKWQRELDYREDLCLAAGEAIEANGAPPSPVNPLVD